MEAWTKPPGKLVVIKPLKLISISNKSIFRRTWASHIRAHVKGQ